LLPDPNNSDQLVKARNHAEIATRLLVSPLPPSHHHPFFAPPRSIHAMTVTMDDPPVAGIEDGGPLVASRLLVKPGDFRFQVS